MNHFFAIFSLILCLIIPGTHAQVITPTHAEPRMDPAIVALVTRSITPCERYYFAYVQATLNRLRPLVTPEIFNLATEYIALVRQQDLTEAHIVALEQVIKARTYQDSPELIGELRKPYDQFTICNRLAIIEPQRISVTTPSCLLNYEADTQELLNILKPEVLPLAQQYMSLVKKYGDDASRLIILDRHFLSTGQVQGMLRQPFTQYVACNDKRAIVPLSH